MARPVPVAFHHACFCCASLDEVRAAKAELAREGRTLLQEGGTGDVYERADFEFPEIGAPIEVLFLDPTKLPPPEAVIGPSA